MGEDKDTTTQTREARNWQGPGKEQTRRSQGNKQGKNNATPRHVQEARARNKGKKQGTCMDLARNTRGKTNKNSQGKALARKRQETVIKHARNEKEEQARDGHGKGE